MSHFTEGVLQAYLDDEVDAGARTELDAHLRGCDACAAQLRELRELSGGFSAAVRLVEAEPAPIALEQLQFRSRQRSLASRLAGSRAGLARAAMIVLGISLAGAAAVPGSPVQDWLIRAWKAITANEVESVQGLPAVEPPPAAEVSNIYGVAPVAGRVRISLNALSNGTRVQVALADSATARVQLIGATGDPNANTSRGRLSVDGAGSSEIRIIIPHSATEAIVEVDGRLYVNKVGGELRFYGPAAESIDPDVIFRHRTP